MADRVRSLGLDPDALAEADVNDLQKSKVISEAQANELRAACRVRAGQAARKRLPIPELGERKSLELRQLQDFRCALPDRVLPGGGSHVPCVDTHALSAAQWLKVFLNCNLTRGRKSHEKLNPSREHVLIPRNTDLSQYLIAAQELDIFEYRMSTDTVHTHSAMMSEASAFADVATPWVSAAMEFKTSSERQRVQRGSKYVEISKRRLPVGSLSLVLGSSIQVEESQKDAAFEVNPDLKTSVQRLLEKGEVITMKDMKNEIFDRFGDVIAMEAEIGVAMYKTKEEVSQSTQEFSADWCSFQAEAGGGAGGFGARAGGGYQQSTQNTTQRGSASAGEQWKVIGDVSAPNDEALKRAQSEPARWRAIHYCHFIPVTQLLPENMRNELTRLFEPEEVVQTPPRLDPRGKTFVRFKDRLKFSIVGNIEYWSNGSVYEIKDGERNGSWITPSCDHFWKIMDEEGIVSFKDGDRASVHDWGKPLHFKRGYVHSSQIQHGDRCEPGNKTFVRLKDGLKFSVVGCKEYWSNGNEYQIKDGTREGEWITPSCDDFWKQLRTDGIVHFRDGDRAVVCNWDKARDW